MQYTVDNILRQSEIEYNTGISPYLTDSEYDILKLESIRIEHDTQTLSHVPVLENTKFIKSPFWMGSVETFFEGDSSLAKWINTTSDTLHITPKLDGASVMYWNENGVPKMANRGRSQDKCQDISNILMYMSLPTLPEGVICRGEFVTTKDYFQVARDKYEYVSHRNMISGMIRHFATNIYLEKKYVDLAKNVMFVMFELIIDGQVYGVHNIPNNLNQILLPLNQFDRVSTYPIQPEVVTEEYMNTITQFFKEQYVYPIDGIVLYLDQYNTPNDKNCPDYCRAYKETINVDSVIVVVNEIRWNQGVTGQLTPTLHFHPVYLCEANISSVTAHNAKIMLVNDIGVGSKIRIIRSGGVIPKIVEVIYATGFELPDIDCYWDEHETHLMGVINDQELIVQKMYNFTVQINAKGIGKSIITHFYHLGCRKIDDMFCLTSSDLIKLGPTKSHTTVNILCNALNKATLVDIMVGSNCFPRGIGRERLEVIVSKYPSLLFNKHNIHSLHNFNDKTTESVMTGITNFYEFIASNQYVGNRVNVLINQNSYISTEYHDQVEETDCVTFTGFRDKNLVEQMKLKGIRYKQNITKETTILVTPDPTIYNNTIKRAKIMNILIMDKASFERMLMS